MTINRLLKQPLPVPDVLAAILAEAGIDQVVGVSGGHTGRIYSTLERFQNSVRTMLVREESLASVMAEIYGRLTGKPGVVMGQGPWILGNGLLGTIEAMLSSTPMVLLTDFSDTPPFSQHGAYQSGTGDYGGWDARQAFKGVTKQVFEAREPAEAPHALQLAIKHAVSGQPGPVAVLLHARSLQGKLGPDSRLRLYPTQYYLPTKPGPVAGDRIDAAVAALDAAARPVLIAGNGVRIAKAYDELDRFARHFDIPVVTTPSGKGVFAETDPRALGVFGTFGTPAANAMLAQADLVVIAGSKMTAMDTALENPELLDPERQVLIQIEIEPRNAGWTFPIEHQLIGDVAGVLGQLVAADAKSAHGEEAVKRVEELRARHNYFDFADHDSDEAPLMPQRIIADLNRTLPGDAILCTDAGENRIFATHFYRVPRAGGFIPSAGAGPMGYGIPAALGAKLVHPDRPVVAFVGDGGFAMTMNGLMSAVEHDIPIIVIVLNNRALGWALHMRGPFAAEFDDFDHAAIARAMGCEGLRVGTPEELAPALKTALACGRPCVIDVATSLKLSYDEITSPYLKMG